MTTDDCLVTTWGTVRLSKKDIHRAEHRRDTAQALLWHTQADEIVGIPEVRLWNDLAINGLQKSQLGIDDHWWR
jgi:hypothetical protein